MDTIGILGSFVLIIALLIVIVNLVKLLTSSLKRGNSDKIKKTLKTWSIILAASFVVVVICVSIPDNGNQNTDESKNTQVEASQKEETTPEPTTVPTPEPTPEPTPTPPPVITKQDIEDNCSSATYKDLLRYTDQHIGDYVVVKVKIHQILKENFGYDTFYFGYTDNDGYEFYFDDEYCIVDERIDDDTKILEDDILVIYGEFTGIKTFRRALTGANDEIPCISALYIDIEN